jgi:hypothetical protein
MLCQNNLVCLTEFVTDLQPCIACFLSLRALSMQTETKQSHEAWGERSGRPTTEMVCHLATARSSSDRSPSVELDDLERSTKVLPGAWADGPIDDWWAKS